MFINKKLIAIFFSLALVLPVVHALEGDTKEPITVESNSGFLDDKEGISVYTGDVIIIQGSFRMEADQVNIYMDSQREIEKMIATGNLVKIKQTPELDKEDLHGVGEKVDYFPATQLVILRGKAIVWQGGNKTASEYIEYDRISEVIKAGDTTLSNKRVHVTLQPSNEDDKK